MKQLISIGAMTLALFSLLTLSAQAEMGPAPAPNNANNNNGVPADGCPNIGAGEELPGSVTEGPPICDTSLDLEIEVPGGGGSVSVGSGGCPSYVEIVPSYIPAVIKPGYQIADTQKNYHQRATFHCVACGFLYLFTCCEMDDSWTDTPNYKLSYQDMPCDVIIPQTTDHNLVSNG